MKNQAVRLLLGAAPMLGVAGAIEGLISPSETVSWPIKWSIGILSGISLYGLFAAGWAGEKAGALGSVGLV